MQQKELIRFSIIIPTYLTMAKVPSGFMKLEKKRAGESSKSKETIISIFFDTRLLTAKGIAD